MKNSSTLSRSSLTNADIVIPAIGGAFRKLAPQNMARNPVMFVVEVLALLVTVLFIRDAVSGGADLGFSFQVIVWLWFTVLFANFAEAVAEGRGKAQAASLRATRSDTVAKSLSGETLKWALGPDAEMKLDVGDIDPVPALDLKPGTIVLIEAGDTIPSDGEVIKGIASVNEAAITGEVGARHSRIRRRPLGGDRRYTGDLRLDRRAHHLGARFHLPRPNDRARRRRAAAEDTE